jgi:predicted nucleic acid-binding protein
VILVDTSVWVEHLRSGNQLLESRLEAGAVLGHPWVTGELALGHLDNRAEVIRLLQALPQADVATPAEVLSLIDRGGLAGAGIGYVDAQLLAATMITAEASSLWTNDGRLRSVASDLGYRFADQDS